MNCPECESFCFPITLNGKRCWKCLTCGKEIVGSEPEREITPARAYVAGNFAGILVGSQFGINHVIDVLEQKDIELPVTTGERVTLKQSLKKLDVMLDQAIDMVGGWTDGTAG